MTCGTDAEVTQKFKTLTAPWGNMAPDPVPFNAAKFGNMDYQVVDWTDQSKSYIDPITGVEFWRLTSPGMIGMDGFLQVFGVLPQTPIDLTGSALWTNLTTQLGTNGASYSNASGTTADKVFIPFPKNQGTAWSSFGGFSSVDDLLIETYCKNASAANIPLVMQLSQDGGQTLIGSPVTTANCPTGAFTKVTYPQASPQPLFRGWGLTSIRHDLVYPQQGSVTVSSSVVTLQSPSIPSNYFNTDWVAGTPIWINGTYYHIASMQSPTALTITENPTIGGTVAYSIANFGVVIWKTVAGTVDVSLGFDFFQSSIPVTGSNADSPITNSVPVSVSKSANGVTTFSPLFQGTSWFWQIRAAQAL